MAIVEEVTLRVDELWQWLLSLDPTFTFLLMLPLLVVAAGFARHAWDQCRARRLKILVDGGPPVGSP